MTFELNIYWLRVYFVPSTSLGVLQTKPAVQGMDTVQVCLLVLGDLKYGVYTRVSRLHSTVCMAGHVPYVHIWLVEDREL